MENDGGGRLLGALMLTFVLLAPLGARALTLAHLAAGASFTAGPLTFDDFDITISGDISLDLADYPVQVLADGFRITGPLTVLFGQAGSVLISYQVSATSLIVRGASLLAPGVALTPGDLAFVSETILGPGNALLGSMFVYAIGGVGTVPSAVATFSPSATLSVAKAVQLGSATFATLPVIDQRFVLVPEPVTLFLLVAGLLGLAVAGRRRDATD